MKKWILMAGLTFLLIFGALIYEFNFKQDFAMNNSNPSSINDLFANVYFLFFGVIILILFLLFLFALIKRKK